MTSSPDGAPVRHDDMPPAIPSMWRALKRGYEAEPLLLVVAFSLSLFSEDPNLSPTVPLNAVSMPARSRSEAYRSKSRASRALGSTSS